MGRNSRVDRICAMAGNASRSFSHWAARRPHLEDQFRLSGRRATKRDAGAGGQGRTRTPRAAAATAATIYIPSSAIFYLSSHNSFPQLPLHVQCAPMKMTRISSTSNETRVFNSPLRPKLREILGCFSADKETRVRALVWTAAEKRRDEEDTLEGTKQQNSGCGARGRSGNSLPDPLSAVAVLNDLEISPRNCCPM